MRQGSKGTDKGCVIKQVATVSHWSLIPLESSGKWCGNVPQSSTSTGRRELRCLYTNFLIHSELLPGSGSSSCLLAHTVRVIWSRKATEVKKCWRLEVRTWFTKVTWTQEYGWSQAVSALGTGTYLVGCTEQRTGRHVRISDPWSFFKIHTQSSNSSSSWTWDPDKRYPFPPALWSTDGDTKTRGLHRPHALAR